MRENGRATPFEPQLEEFVHRIRLETGVPGLAVAVTRARQRTMVVAGSVTAERPAPLGADARYHIGCITKLLLAMLVLELSTEGALALDAPAAEYVPELRGTAVGAGVRVSHLLSHTSGYRGTHVLDRSIADWASFVEFLRRTPLLFAPGTVFSYEHTEALLLAAIVGRTMGRSSLELVEERLLNPLGIVPCRLDDCDERADAGRHHFDPRSGRFLAVPRPSPPAPLWLPAFSDLVLTLGELATIADAAAGRDDAGLLSPPTVRALATSVVPLPTSLGGPLRDLLPVGFGHGTAEFRDGSRGNTGVSTGQCVGLRFHPASGSTIAVALNAAAPPLRDFVLGTVSGEIAGRRPSREHAPFDLDFARLTGAYVGPGDACADVSAEADKLVCELGRAGSGERLRVELARAPSGELVLHSAVPQLSLAFFEEPDSGRIALLVGLSAYRRLPL
jgi:D-alanyl-D-alanine carboxypeptidase